MAKVKKKELSLEEKLEQALVPEEEWPYEVPGNWVWVRLGGIANFIGGGTPSKSVAAYWNGDIPWASVKDIKGDFLTETIDRITSVGLQNSASNICDIDDLILVTRIEPGKTIISKIQTAINQDLKIVKSALPSKYLHYFFTNNRQEFVRFSNGSTVLGITLDNIVSFKVPLPPIAEQERIVHRIESLFAKLDQAKELAQNALDSYEARKAAILHKAFTGELTAKWRVKNGVGMDSWEEKLLGEVCESFQYGTSKKSNNIGKVVVIRMGNLQNGEIVWDNLAYTDDEEDIKKYMLKPGDVLFNRTNSPELVGKTAIYRGEFPAIFAGYLIRLNYTNKLNGNYLNYVMNSPFAKEYCSLVKSDGINQSNISAKKIANFSLPVPPLSEQQEIVRILDSLFEKEKKAKELYDVIEKIDLMKKAILARAFRGKLGTNDPNEESAMELLKEVLKDK